MHLCQYKLLRDQLMMQMGEGKTQRKTWAPVKK